MVLWVRQQGRLTWTEGSEALPWESVELRSERGVIIILTPVATIALDLTVAGCCSQGFKNIDLFRPRDSSLTHN